MGEAYPELVHAEALITDTLRLEETRFRGTLERGLHLLEEDREAASGGVLAGVTAFKLYDTYGFPLDLTQDALRAKGIASTSPASRPPWTGSARSPRGLGRLGRGGDRGGVVRPSASGCGASEFLGYETESAEGEVAPGGGRRRSGAGQRRRRRAIVCNQTPFYGESGGQVGDHGRSVGAPAPSSASATPRRSSAISSSTSGW